MFIGIPREEPMDFMFIQFKEFLRLSSSFSNDIFIGVRTLFIRDYHFFNRINQSLPLIEILIIANSSPQINQSQLNSNLEQMPMVTFHRLANVDLSYLHIDYIEQFLFNRYTHLPRLRQLDIDYGKLITSTNCFQDDPTRFNCLQVRRLISNESFVRPQNFSRFFPLLE